MVILFWYKDGKKLDKKIAELNGQVLHRLDEHAVLIKRHGP